MSAGGGFLGKINYCIEPKQVAFALIGVQNISL